MAGDEGSGRGEVTTHLLASAAASDDLNRLRGVKHVGAERIGGGLDDGRQHGLGSRDSVVAWEQLRNPPLREIERHTCQHNSGPVR